MTLPLLLLGLYFGLLVVAIALTSWAGHSVRPPGEARRVTDAAERAGLSHLASPARLAMGCVVALSCVSGAFSIATDKALSWFVLGPLLAPPLVAVALLFSSRRLLHASGQLLGAASSDERMALTSRSAMGAVLCSEATVGLLLLSLHALATRELGDEDANHLILFVSSSIALATIVLSRAAASVHYSIAQGAQQNRQSTFSDEHGEEGSSASVTSRGDDTHAASLAVLVSSSFHAPLLRLTSLVLISTLGTCALLTILSPTSADSQKLWLYPHLLRVLGFFSLLFAGLVSRTSEDEQGWEGWIRGAVVYLVLMVAGSWSLSSELPVGWARSVPSGMSFLYISLGVAVLLGGRQDAASSSSWGSRALSSLTPSVVFLGLVVVLATTTTFAVSDPPLPEGTLSSLLLVGTLAVVPLSVVWLLARDLSFSSPEASKLAFAGEPYRSAGSGSPSGRMLRLLPHLGLVVALSSLSAVPLVGPKGASLSFLVLGIGATLGGLVVAALMGLLERACQKTISALRRLVRSADAAAEINLDFESAVVACKEAIKSSDIKWVLLALAPAIVSLSTAAYVPSETFLALNIGLSLGAVLVGVGIELLSIAHPDGARRTLANLSLCACTAQALWLVAAGGSLT